MIFEKSLFALFEIGRRLIISMNVAKNYYLSPKL